jgi:hypothetical protein
MKSKGIVLGEGHVNTIRSGASGINPGKPAGFKTGAETVPDRFEGDQRGNRQVEADNGWPANKLGSTYNSDPGNPGDASRTRLADRYGKNVSGAGPIDQNDPKANGNGVILDGMNRGKGYEPPTMRTTDSPVRDDAPFFDTSTIREENLAHLGRGEGVSDDLVEDDLVRIDGGVLSR